jgi:Domain of unknown function (DUF4902)
LNKLGSLEWKHYFSTVDEPQSDSIRTGATEWTANTEGVVLSLGWDWKETKSDGVVVDVMGGVRTNLLVIDKDGYDFSFSASETCLLFLISKLDWKQL